MKNTYIAEFLGTFALATVVGLSVAGSFAIATPLLAALTLGLFVYTVGHVSGTHINPAVTLGLLSIKKISGKTASYYIAAQIAAGIVAMVVVNFIYPTMPHVGGTSLNHVLGEFLGTFFFAFGIASVVYGKTPKDVSGFAIGGSLLLGIAFAALIGSAGVLNPSVALALGTFNLVYLFAPIFGSVAGMMAYQKLASHA